MELGETSPFPRGRVILVYNGRSGGDDSGGCEKYEVSIYISTILVKERVKRGAGRGLTVGGHGDRDLRYRRRVKSQLLLLLLLLLLCLNR